MALRHRLEKKGTGRQVKAMPGRRNNHINAGMSAYTVPANKYPYACNLNINNSAGFTGIYAHASSVNVPTYAMPIDKHLYTCNATVPVQKVSKSRQPANNPTSRISQPPAALDVALPSSFWRLRQHVSLDFDAHKQKIVSKKNQIAATWRHLSPQLKRKKHEVKVVADVFEVPPELFQLKDLKDILSLEAWKECLSLSERRFLRQLLPEGLDHGSLVRTILRGDNFYFGNPLANWGSLLLKEELHPDRVDQREAELKQAYDEHYEGLQKYHEKMLERLGELKEEWILCKSKKKAISSRARRRKLRLPDSKAVIKNTVEGCALWQNSKRQKVANFEQAYGSMDLTIIKDNQNMQAKLENDINSDCLTYSMHVLKVTRKQYDGILLLMGNEDELSADILQPVLNLQQKLEVNRAISCYDDDNAKTRKYWFEVVVADISVGHIAFAQRKAEKYKMAKLMADQCMRSRLMFLSKDVHMDLQNGCNTVSSFELEEHARGFQGSIASHNNSRNSSPSKSSVTCLEGKVETECPVDSCLSSADSTQRILSQSLIQDDHVSLIDLPHGSSLASEGHATLLSPVQAPRERTNFEDNLLFDDHDSLLTGNGTTPQEDTDTLSGCNEGFVVKTSLIKDSFSPQEIKSNKRELVNWNMHSKPALDVVRAAAASGESEEVEQRVVLQPGGDLNHSLYQLSASSSLGSQQETTGKEPWFGSKYLPNTENLEHKQYQVHSENILNLNIVGRSPLSVPLTEEVSRSERVNANDSSRVFEMECAHVENETNSQMMLHLFMDDPKPHSNDFLSTDASSNQGLSGKYSFCESNEVPSLTSCCASNPMIREHEPITELSLLVDDRTAKQTYHSEQAESVSSRTQNEYFQQCTMEPHWVSRRNRQEDPAYAFSQHSRELHHLLQSNQDACSSIPFSHMQPIWPQSAISNLCHPSFANYWNVDDHVDQRSWIPSNATIGTHFLPGKDESGKPPVSLLWDQASQGPCMDSESTKHEHGFLRGNTLNLNDEHMYASLDSLTRLQSQASSHLPYTWAMDRSGRISSHPWQNASVLSSSHYEQQKLQNALLSKLNPNFTSSWH